MISDENTVDQESTEEKKVDESGMSELEAGWSEETAVIANIPEEIDIIDDADASSEEEAQPKKRKMKRMSPALREVVAWFAACGRCSFFLAGYRLIGDEEMLETAVARRSKKWLAMPWSHDLAVLLQKTYGNRIDSSYYHIEGQCPECSRRFTYQRDETKDESATFRIELKP